MKHTIMTIAVLLAVVGGKTFGQAQVPLSSPHDTTLPPPPFSPKMRARNFAVSEFMRAPSPSDVGALTFSSMGDETAFHLSYILSKRPLRTPAQTIRVLEMIHKSFSRPEAIVDASNLNPKMSLQLLKMIEATATDQMVKEGIAAEQAFLSGVPKTITRARPVYTSAPIPGGMPVNP
jgi:hypothetical protein